MWEGLVAGCRGGGLRLVSQKIQWQLREEEQSPKSVKLSPPLFVVPGLYIFI